jgi:hypothetical protein
MRAWRHNLGRNDASILNRMVLLYAVRLFCRNRPSSMRERSGSAAAGAEHRVARFPRENTMPLFSADCDALKK